MGSGRVPFSLRTLLVVIAFCAILFALAIQRIRYQRSAEELSFQERIDVPKSGCSAWCFPAPLRRCSNKPDYLPASFMRLLEGAGFHREDLDADEA